MRKVLGLFLLATLAVTIEVSQNQIDTVEQLLAQLKGTTQSELNQLNEDYHTSRAAKENIIGSLQIALQQQRGECNDRDRDVADRTRDIEVTNNYIAWLNERLSVNAARVQRLKDNRCAQNTNYLEGLRSQKISLRLIIFLRNALQNANQFSFAQQQEMGKYILRFLAIYKHAKKDELLQLTNELESTFKTKIEVEHEDLPELVQQVSISGTKQELIEILNQLERDIRASIASAQEQEVNVGVRLAEYFGQLDLENKVLSKTVVDEQRNLESLKSQLTTSTTAAEICKARLAQFSNTVTVTQNELQSSTNLYNSQVKRLQEELGLFQDVYRIYASKVATQDDRFKNRVQDYVDNKQFDQGAYTNRNTFGDLQGSVGDAVRAQAEREAQVA